MSSISGFLKGVEACILTAKSKQTKQRKVLFLHAGLEETVGHSQLKHLRNYLVFYKIVFRLNQLHIVHVGLLRPALFSSCFYFSVSISGVLLKEVFAENESKNHEDIIISAVAC